MFDPFSKALTDLGDFGDKFVQEPLRLAQEAVKRGEGMQPKLQRPWAEKRGGYHAMTISPIDLLVVMLKLTVQRPV